MGNTNMKITHQIRTGDFEYIMEELEVETHEQAVEAHQKLKSAFQTKDYVPLGGLDDKDWRIALDGYLTIGNLPSDVYERMNDTQKNIMQEIKKSMKRINPPELREHSLKRT